MLHLQPNAYCHLPATEKPKFIVVIDAEEEFNDGLMSQVMPYANIR
jgi:hypothetical protein